MRILVEPKNALVKQYQKFFHFDDVDLVFSDDALDAIADEALKRATGARGLRAILEESLLEVMYDLPSRSDIVKCIVDREVVMSQGRSDARHRGRGAPLRLGASAGPRVGSSSTEPASDCRRRLCRRLAKSCADGRPGPDGHRAPAPHNRRQRHHLMVSWRHA